MNKKLLTLAISITLMSSVGTMNSAYAKNPHEYPPQCVNPATGELKPNAAQHAICADAVKELGGSSQTEEQNSDESTGTSEPSEDETTTDEGTTEENSSEETTTLIISELTLEQIAAFTAVEIASLTGEQLAQFSAEQIAHISLVALVGLSVEQVPYLNIQAVSGFSVGQLDALPDVVKVAFTAEQRLNMVAYLFPALSPEVTVPTESVETTLPEEEGTDDTAASLDEGTLPDESTTDETTSSEEEGTSDTSASPDDAESTTTEVPEEVVLPVLGTEAVNAEGEIMNTTAQIEGGLTVGGTLVEEVSLEDGVQVSGLITVDPQHVGQVADVIVYAAYRPIDHSLENPVYFMLDENLGIHVWDENPIHLVSFMKAASSDEASGEIPVTVYDGKFILPGILNISIGYRLLDGTLVVNSKTIDVTITSQAASTEETDENSGTQESSTGSAESGFAPTEGETSSTTGTDTTATEDNGTAAETNEASNSSTEGVDSSATETHEVASSETATSSSENEAETISTSSETIDSSSNADIPAIEPSSDSEEEVEENAVPAV